MAFSLSSIENIRGFAKINAKICLGAIYLLMSVYFSSCFTGIESTKKITMTKSEQKEAAPTAEELYLANIRPTENPDWPAGKIFIVTGERAGLLFEPRRIVSGDFTLHTGDTLRYVDSKTVKLPDGNIVSAPEFMRDEDLFRYMPPTHGKRESISSDQIPGIVDPSLLEEVGKLMIGKTFWTLSPVWESPEGEMIEGRKYEKVTVRQLLPGTMVFPARVVFVDEGGREGSMLMSLGNSGNDSRGFANLFRLTDPRADYPAISDKVWEAVRRGEVIAGMTKDECRLAKGNPKEVNNGKGYQHTVMIWTYQDGMVLYFVDDILNGINAIPKDNRDY